MPLVKGRWELFGLGYVLSDPADDVSRIFGHGGDPIEDVHELVSIAEKVDTAEAGCIAKRLGRDLDPVFTCKRQKIAEIPECEIAHRFRIEENLAAEKELREFAES